MIKRKSSGRAVAADARRAPAAADRAVAVEDSALARVRELARIATEYDLGEIEFDPSGKIRISRMRASAASAAHAPLVSAPAAAPVASAPALVKAPVEDDNAAYVTSPFVGTFYRSPSPEAASFVEVGGGVRKGQVVCIVEAMKLMNEIESEVDGKVLEVMVSNGEHVEYGQKLLRIAKS
jgi:acetyl-CoA carboxylase biotin carboxyl carrier protein